MRLGPTSGHPEILRDRFEISHGAQQKNERKDHSHVNAVSKKYDEASKRQAVEMVLRGAKQLSRRPRSLASANSIYEWKKKFFPLVCFAGIDGKNISFSRTG
jgi:hypothetical protein